MIEPLLSRCVVAYVGTAGRLDRRSAEERVAEAEGDAGRQVLPRVRDVVNDVYSAEPPLWQAASLSEIGRKVEAHLKAHRPELSDEAVQAICNNYTYDWK